MAETLTIVVDDETAAKIRELVESGAYPDAAEILRASIDALGPLQAPYGWTDEDVRAAVEESDREGGEMTVDEAMDSIRSELRTLYAQRLK